MPFCCCCFPGNTPVTTKHGEKRMENLLPSDEVLTINKKRGGQKWTKFFTWGHREAYLVAKYIQLRMSNGKELHISGEHLLFVAGEKGRVAKRAAYVTMDDQLYHLNDSGILELKSIFHISTEKITGVYAPFTTSGDFLANGFLVACYANVDNFEVAHAAVAPLRAWHKVRLTSSEENRKENEGIHGFAKKLMKVRDLLPLSIQMSVRIRN